MAVSNPRILAPFFEWNGGQVSLDPSDAIEVVAADPDRVYLRFQVATAASAEIFLSPGPGADTTSPFYLNTTVQFIEFRYRDIGPIIGRAWTAGPDFSTPQIHFFEALYRPRAFDEVQLELEHPREGFD